MKEKELSSADKCRRTKLRKKSVEELVNIILRKDDVWWNLIIISSSARNSTTTIY